ncbi:TetR/AcrR family transcriptional regulator [Streptomyces sp. HNM0574]|uniref:TetR family transcriptional regulator n=1 Tax=Streptomyces sp. HNM0574 TaxID=2714954 RepID=UPI00146A541B|nr:TetR/AcrR family transcriptional regulator [Streptomyces sp. HNM0574]
MQLRAEQTRRTLINVAAEMFDARGHRGTGLADISRGAGVSKGALYFHFDSKEELTNTVLTEARERALAVLRRHLTGSAPGFAGLARFTLAFAEELRNDPVLRAGLRLQGERGESPTLRQEWIGYLHRHFSDGTGGKAMADLLAALTVGLDTLGRDAHEWWSEETVSGVLTLLGDLIAHLPDDPPPASAPTAEAPTV